MIGQRSLTSLVKIGFRNKEMPVLFRRNAERANSSKERSERLDGGNVRGSLIRNHLDWVRQHRDRDEVIEFFDALQPSLRNIVESSWYPFERLVSVERTIVGTFAAGDARLLEEVGAFTARHALSRESVLNASSIHDFLGSFVHLRGDVQDFGRTAYHAMHEHDGRMIHHDELSFSPLYCAMSAGFYRESIELHGGHDVQVWESKCQCRGESSCTFELLWD